jgi:hypothetical protein
MNVVESTEAYDRWLEQRLAATLQDWRDWRSR